jgi:hypothetical protein
VTEAPADAAVIVGTWRLRSWVSEGEDGSIEEPMGASPDGILVYAVDGTMITTIGARERPPITGADIVSGSAGEIVAMARSFVAYAGRYRLEGHDVVHAVELSLYPNWVGTEQRRHVEISGHGSVLTLTSDPIVVRGRLGRQRLVWEAAGRTRAGEA